MIKNIRLNQIQCKKCGDIITSEYMHDYKTCSCGACAVDGGHEYLRRSFVEKDCYIELAVYEVDYENNTK